MPSSTISNLRKNSDNIYKAALIGCGRIGADYGPEGTGSSRILSHAQAYVDHPKTKLVAAFDLDGLAVQQSGRRWKIPNVYGNLRQLLEGEKPDFLSVTTPAQSHLPLLQEIAEFENVRAILLEKPIAPSLSESRAILDLFADRTVAVAVNYIRRFPPIYRQILWRLRQGEFGKIQHVQVYYTKGVLNNASHAIDLLRAFLGEVDHVAATGQPLESTYPEPTLSFQLRFTNDIWGNFVALDHANYNLFEIDILASEARVTFRDQGHVVEIVPVKDTRDQHGFRQLDVEAQAQPTELSRAIYFAIDDLMEAIENNRPPACTLDDGHAAAALAFEVLSHV